MAHGATSKGRCKLCRETKMFRNSANDYIWDRDYGRLSPVKAALEKVLRA